MSHIYALVDCNNFFVSCERVFAPKLENKAVVVLSNNDGCAIARSNEAKALGIKMGEPFFKFASLYKTKQVEIFSSNFSLYSNMSLRVMESLRLLCPKLEVYSVDEAFLDLTEVKDLNSYALDVQEKIKQWIGIPVSIGIAPTKTLAKLANYMAKKTNGIFNLCTYENIDSLLATIPIEEIWGVGRKLNQQLRIMGIDTAKDLKYCDVQLIRKKFSVVLERTVHELRGTPCLELETVHKEKKSITYSRSFGQTVNNLEELEEALSSFASNACVKLRKENLRAQSVCVAIRTNYFRKNTPQYSNSFNLTLPFASSDTREIVHYAKKALEKIYIKDFNYHKLAIILLDLVPAKQEQMNLFAKTDYEHSDKLMQTLDSINQKLGKHSIFVASEGINKNWQSQRQNRSPEYTTNWSNLPIVV